MLEITVRGPRNPKVALHFLIDVDETRRRPNAGLDRKAEPMRLPRPVIEVLAKNHHAHILRWRRVERCAPVAWAREEDRKSVVEGQSVCVRVNLGGPRIM